jgi:sulfhydrogenase subunit delta
MKPRIAVHKFASCDGCQLALLNAGELLLDLAERAEIVHYARAGWVAPDAEVDIALVEGSICTVHDVDRIKAIREKSRYLISIGACATAGGVQALRQTRADGASWLAQVYANPQFIDSLAESVPIARHVPVDLELWGCPVTTRQVFAAIEDLLAGIAPLNPATPVCLDCKRKGQICVLVAKGEPCMGPVTRTGCGALCPGLGRDCYGCFGPSQVQNTASLAARFRMLGLGSEAVGHRFHHINSGAPAFSEAGRLAVEKGDD